MRIVEALPLPESRIRIALDNGRIGYFDVKPYLDLPVFTPLKDAREFARLRSAGYYIEWTCGADLSADTVEAHLTES